MHLRIKLRAISRAHVVSDMQGTRNGISKYRWLQSEPAAESRVNPRDVCQECILVHFYSLPERRAGPTKLYKDL